MLGPIVRGEKITLEPMKSEDLALMQAWRADPDVIRYLPYRSVPSAGQLEEWYEATARSETEVLWVITANGASIGYTDIGPIYWRSRSARTGLAIGDMASRGKGYASEAVLLRAAFAFEELNLQRLEADSLAANVPMHRALQKAGYQQVGIRRQYVYGAGQWHDSYLFELLRDDWLQRAELSLHLS